MPLQLQSTCAVFGCLLLLFMLYLCGFVLTNSQLPPHLPFCRFPSLLYLFTPSPLCLQLPRPSPSSYSTSPASSSSSAQAASSFSGNRPYSLRNASTSVAKNSSLKCLLTARKFPSNSPAL